MEFLKLAALLFMMFFVTAIFQPTLITQLYRSTGWAARWAFRLVALLFLFSYAMALPALAAASSLINISPELWDEINKLIVAIVVGILGLVGNWIWSHIKLQNAQTAAMVRSAWQDLLDKGAQYGATQLQAAEKNVGAINVGNPGVAAAANFVIAHGPDLAKKAGYDITTDDGRAAVVRSVTLRLGDIMAAPQKPPSIPLPAAVTPPSQ